MKVYYLPEYEYKANENQNFCSTSSINNSHKKIYINFRTRRKYFRPVLKLPVWLYVYEEESRIQDNL